MRFVRHLSDESVRRKKNLHFPSGLTITIKTCGVVGQMFGTRQKCHLVVENAC